METLFLKGFIRDATYTPYLNPEKFEAYDQYLRQKTVGFMNVVRSSCEKYGRPSVIYQRYTPRPLTRR